MTHMDELIRAAKNHADHVTESPFDEYNRPYSNEMKIMAWRMQQIIKHLDRETPESVRAWQDATFGKTTIGRQFEKTKEEFKELCQAVEGFDPPEKVAFEAADVIICLYRIIAELNPKAIEQKMNINRARRWNVVNGVGQHITEEVT